MQSYQGPPTHQQHHLQPLQPQQQQQQQHQQHQQQQHHQSPSQAAHAQPSPSQQPSLLHKQVQQVQSVGSASSQGQHAGHHTQHLYPYNYSPLQFSSSPQGVAPMSSMSFGSSLYTPQHQHTQSPSPLNQVGQSQSSQQQQSQQAAAAVVAAAAVQQQSNQSSNVPQLGPLSGHHQPPATSLYGLPASYTQSQSPLQHLHHQSQNNNQQAQVGSSQDPMSFYDAKRPPSMMAPQLPHPQPNQGAHTTHQSLQHMQQHAHIQSASSPSIQGGSGQVSSQGTHTNQSVQQQLQQHHQRQHNAQQSPPFMLDSFDTHPSDLAQQPPAKKQKPTPTSLPPTPLQSHPQPAPGKRVAPVRASTWTKAEEDRLRMLVEAGTKWGQITKEFPNRTAGAIKKHYYADMKHTVWNSEEDAKLSEAVREDEENKWKRIAEKVGKPAKACEKRIKELMRMQPSLTQTSHSQQHQSQSQSQQQQQQHAVQHVQPGTQQSPSSSAAAVAAAAAAANMIHQSQPNVVSVMHSQQPL
ncbi:hypothetical protein V1511DRAFT_512795 [Dipodascopsis uninucleata]